MAEKIWSCVVLIVQMIARLCKIYMIYTTFKSWRDRSLWLVRSTHSWATLRRASEAESEARDRQVLKVGPRVLCCLGAMIALWRQPAETRR
jgi:hypothetical protein